MLHVVVCTPGFTKQSGGVYVLHCLCHILNTHCSNVKAYVCDGCFKIKRRDFTVNKALNAPVAPRNLYNACINGLLGEHGIAIYPEVVKGNPFGATRIIRWILHFKTLQFFDPCDSVERMMYFCPSFNMHDLSSQCPIDPVDSVVTIFDLKLSKEFVLKRPRIGLSYSLYRGGGDCWSTTAETMAKKIPKFVMQNARCSFERAICVDGKRDTKTLARVFRECKYYVNDTAWSFTSLVAASHGCISVILPQNGWTAEQIREAFPLMRFGVAYGFEDNEVERAQKTVKFAAINLRIIHRIGIYNLKNVMATFDPDVTMSYRSSQLQLHQPHHGRKITDNPDKVFFSVFVMVKDEIWFLPQFIAFYVLNGAERIIIYNNTEDKDDESLKVSIGSLVNFVTIIHFPGSVKKWDALAHCIEQQRQRTEWLLIVDVDEFAFSNKHPTLRALLSDFSAKPEWYDVGGFGISMVMFNGGGHVRCPGLLLDNFTRTHGACEITFKCCVRPAFVTKQTPHFPFLDNGKRFIDLHGNLLDTAEFTFDDCTDVAQVNHYYCGFFEEFYRRKVQRIRDDAPIHREFAALSLDEWWTRPHGSFDVKARDRFAIPVAEMLFKHAPPSFWDACSMDCTHTLQREKSSGVEHVFSVECRTTERTKVCLFDCDGIDTFCIELSCGDIPRGMAFGVDDVSFTNDKKHLVAPKNAGYYRSQLRKAEFWVCVENINVPFFVQVVHAVNGTGHWKNYHVFFVDIVTETTFDSQRYCQENKQVSSGAALQHWATHGRKQGCRAHCVSHDAARVFPSEEHFDAETYFEQNPDVRASGMNAWTHWQLHGRHESRSACWNCF
jgi:hypothetical protein